MGTSINLEKGTYTSNGKTYSIKGGVNSQQAQAITNAVNSNPSSGVSISNDTSGSYRQGGTGAWMYNGQPGLADMSFTSDGNILSTYSDGTTKTINAQSGEVVKQKLGNIGSLPARSMGLSNTYANNYGDTGGAITKPVYKGFGTASGYNSKINLGTLGNNYLFGTNAENEEKTKPGYLEDRNNELASAFLNSGVTDKDSILDFLKKNYSDFGNYDIQGQNNTAQAIYNRIGQLSSQQNQDGFNTDIDPNLLNNANNTANGDYWNTVNSILKNAYGIGDLNQFKDMFGSEAYYSLLQGLQSTEGAWNATDPNSRQQLDGYIQGILGAGVGTAVEQSQLNLNKESILGNFSEDSRARLEQDLLDVQNLATRGYNLEQIADETGMSTDQVRQLVLLNQGQPSKIGEYYEMSSRAEDMITEDYDRARNNLMENYKANLERQNQQIEWLKQDFNEAFEKQQANNEANLHNIDMVMGMSGTGYSRRGMEGVGIAQRQAKGILDDLMNNYDRSNAEIGRMIQQLTMSYRQNDAELVDQINDALLQAKNNYIANTNAIQQKYGLVGLQGQQAMSQAVKDFCQQAENIYNNAFNRAWTNTNNLITAVSNIGAIQQQQIQTRQMKIAEFQQDSMYMTQQQLANYAQQNGLQMEYDQLVAYQQEATVGALTSAGLNGSKYFGQVQKMLAQGYTPQQALYKIVNSPEAQTEIQRAQQAGNWKSSGMGIYDTQAIQQEIGAYANQYVSGLQEGQLVNGQKKQCGAFVNDYLQSMGLGRVFTDPIDKKAAATNSDTPTVGSVVVMTSPTQPQYGHVGIVKSIDYNTGKMTIAQTNYNGDGAYHESTIPMNSNKILGYYDPAVAMAGQGGTQQQQNNGYDPSLEYVFENMLANDGKIDSTTQNNLLKYGYSMQSLGQQYNAYKQSKGVTENTYKLPQGFTVTDPSLFNQMAASEQKSIKSTLTSYNSMMSTAEKLKKLVLKYGAEVRPTDAKNEMQQYVRDIQLQAKELYNLGVLNGPDLSLMEDIIYNPASLKAKWQSVLNLRSKEDVWRIVENGINTVNNQALEKLQNYGISVAGSQTNTTTSGGGGGRGTVIN